MKMRPAKHRRMPGYPTRLDVMSNPDLLKENLPSRWTACAPVAGTVAFFLTAAATSVGAGKGSPMAPDAPAVVAPLFQHGEGRGATGCVVLNPPLFLSEEGALQIIAEEMAKSGVHLVEKDRILEEVILCPAPQGDDRVASQLLYPEDWFEKGLAERLESVVKPKPLQVDLVDPQRQIAVEFVTPADYLEWKGPDRDVTTVQEYDIRGAANALGQAVGATGKGITFAAFYDPMGPGDPKALLIEQVRDFVNWLQAQGAI